MLSPLGIDDKASSDLDSFLAVIEFLFIKKIAIKNPTAKLTKLTNEQGEYINVPVNGPFKNKEYRY